MQSTLGIGLIGLTLLLTAIALYIFGHKRWSLLMYVSFLSDGFEVLTDSVIGMKNIDMAFIYTIVILPFSLLYEKNHQKTEDRTLTILVLTMLGFLICSALFSFQYYKFTPVQILQGGRYLLLFMGYFFVVKTKREDVLWTIDKIWKVTVIVSVLYILEVFFDWSLLSYGMEVRKEATTGLSRYYNSPFYLPLCIYIGIFTPRILKTRFRMPGLIILIIAQIATLGRVEIAATFLMVLLGIMLKGNRTQVVRILFVLTILYLPMSEIIQNRFTGTNNSELDVKAVFDGSYKDLTQRNISNNGTLTYRFAWVYERRTYLDSRPLPEKFFGLGLISDSQFYEVLSRYHFHLGLRDPNTGMPLQMKTPDISYGNMLTMLGYGGGTLLMVLWLYIAVQGFRHRREQPFDVVLFLLITGYIIRSFSGIVVSDPGNLIVPFMIYSCYELADKKKKEENAHENRAY